jgi:cell division ATPase FtsA
MYRKILKNGEVKDLDKANEIVCEAIEKLRPLAKPSRVGRA